MYKIHKSTISIFCILFLSLGYGQEKDSDIAKGNNEYSAKKYDEAEANYRISGSKVPKKTASSYNLGNAIYAINKPEEASFSYSKALENAKTRPEKHKIYHNLGNVCMKTKDYTNAVAAYKNALVNNPDDEETRYNYALAKKMLKDNPPKNDKKDKDKKDKDKDKKDKGDKDKKDPENKGGDKDKDKNGEPKQDKGQEGKGQQQPKPEGGGISKQRLENLLDAVNNEEKKVQEKVSKDKQKSKPIKNGKDW